MTPHGLLKRGSVTIMTGLLAIPLIAMTGVAIDLGRIWLVSRGSRCRSMPACWWWRKACPPAAPRPTD